MAFLCARCCTLTLLCTQQLLLLSSQPFNFLIKLCFLIDPLSSRAVRTYIRRGNANKYIYKQTSVCYKGWQRDLCAYKLNITFIYIIEIDYIDFHVLVGRHLQHSWAQPTESTHNTSPRSRGCRYRTNPPNPLQGSRMQMNTKKEEGRWSKK